jgi:hypothetical protein
MPRRRQFSNQQLIDQLVGCAERLGHSPTESQFDADPETTVSGITIRKRFHGWNEALAEAGLEPTKHGRKPMGKQVIIEMLVACKDDLGRVPTGSEFCEHSGLSMGTIYRAFGTWNKALSEAKLTAAERGMNQRYSDTDMLLQLSAWISVHGREPNFGEFSQAEGTVSAQAIVERFGSWSAAKAKARKLVTLKVVSGESSAERAA